MWVKLNKSSIYGLLTQNFQADWQQGYTDNDYGRKIIALLNSYLIPIFEEIFITQKLPIFTIYIRTKVPPPSEITPKRPT